MKQFNDSSLEPVLLALCKENILFWKEPIQATSSSLITIHGAALMEGRMEFAMSSALHSCRHSFMSGKTLAELSDSCASVAAKMVCLNIEQVMSSLLINS